MCYLGTLGNRVLPPDRFGEGYGRSGRFPSLPLPRCSRAYTPVLRYPSAGHVRMAAAGRTRCGDRITMIPAAPLTGLRLGQRRLAAESVLPSPQRLAARPNATSRLYGRSPHGHSSASRTHCGSPGYRSSITMRSGALRGLSERQPPHAYDQPPSASTYPAEGGAEDGHRRWLAGARGETSPT